MAFTKKQEEDLQRSYQLFPKLREYNDDIVRYHYEILCDVAPTAIAARPLVAGGYLKGSLNMGYIGAAEIKNLCETEIKYQYVCRGRTAATLVETDRLRDAFFAGAREGFHNDMDHNVVAAAFDKWIAARTE